MMRRGFAVFLVALSTCSLVVLSACSSGSPGVVVFAAASLSEPFRDLASAFEESHPASEVYLNLGASSLLAAQISSGVGADVFAPADQQQMRTAGVSQAQIFAVTRIVMVTSRGATAINDLPALASPGVRVVLAAAQVPAGNYARAYLEEAGVLDAVLNNLVSNEADVKGVLNKVRLGEADAGIVYRTDLTPEILTQVRMVELPDDADTLVRYPIAALSKSIAAEDFVEFVLSRAGAQILRSHGFALP